MTVNVLQPSKPMRTNQHSIRIPVELDDLIRAEARIRLGGRWTDQVVELLDEAVRVRRCPGVVFRDGAVGRRAVIEGTGIDVWAVVQEWHSAATDFDVLQEAFPQLSERQLRAALNYYAVYAAEIDERLEAEDRWTPDALRAELPFTQGLPG